MENNQLKIFLSAFVFVVTLLFSSCTQKGEGILSYTPVDLSKHKLSPSKAENLSKRYIKDMNLLFAQSDSLEYYKNLTAKLKSELENETSGKKSSNLKQAIDFKSKKPKFELAVSDWYSVDELLTYIGKSIYTVEASGGKVDGFRVYIGVFPAKGEGEKNNTLTTFITPTGTMGDTQQKGNMLNLSLPFYAVSPDITSVNPLEYGSDGNPPSANYPQ